MKNLSFIFLMAFSILFIASCGEQKMEDVEKEETEQAEGETGEPAEEPADEPVGEDAETIPSDYSNSPLVGYVVSMNNLAMGGDGKVTRAQAKQLVENNQPLLFRADNRVYFVYNADGSFAAPQLANFGGLDRVGLLGEVNVVNGQNVFIMTKIESME
ncbi:MAG: hypothetical protein ACLFR2_01775 [Candidatus Kapaibacterium sp.]